MTLLTDVAAEFHDLDVNFCDDVRCARSALEVLHQKVVQNERGFTNHTSCRSQQRFYKNMQVGMAEQ